MDAAVVVDIFNIIQPHHLDYLDFEGDFDISLQNGENLDELRFSCSRVLSGKGLRGRRVKSNSTYLSLSVGSESLSQY